MQFHNEMMRFHKERKSITDINYWLHERYSGKSTDDLIRFADQTREKQSKLGVPNGLYMIMEAQVKAIEAILKGRKAETQRALY